MTSYQDLGIQSKVAEWNGGLAQSMRIDELQKILNNANINLEAFNLDYQKYNYEVKFEVLKALVSESSGKADEKKELPQAMGYIGAITYFLNKYNIIDKSDSGYNAKTTVNKENFAILSDWLFKFEFLVRKILEEHDFNTPNKYQSRGLM